MKKLITLFIFVCCMGGDARGGQSECEETFFSNLRRVEVNFHGRYG